MMDNHPMPRSRSLRIDPLLEAELAKLCLLHLDCEESLLAETEDVLRKLYAAAIDGNRQGMAEALQRQQAAENALATLRRERDSFRQQASTHLGIPAETVTVTRLALHFRAEISSRILEKRQSLQQRVAGVKRLGREFILLSHYVLDYLKRFFIELTGGVKCGRYGPEGLRHESVCGSLLQAKG